MVTDQEWATEPGPISRFALDRGHGCPYGGDRAGHPNKGATANGENGERPVRPGTVLRRLVVLAVVSLSTLATASPALADDFNWSYLPWASYGSYGGHVIGVQTALTAREYYLCGAPGCYVDGDFGGNTYWAVVAFQQNHGLDDDGVVGWDTWGSLQNGLVYIGGAHPNYALLPQQNTSYYDGIYDGPCTWNSFINADAYPTVFGPGSTYRMGLTYIYQQPQTSSCLV